MSRSPAAPAVNHWVPTGRRPAADCLAFDMTLLMALLLSEIGGRLQGCWVYRLALASPANLECLEHGSFIDVARPDSAI
ncbi:uncharacterized protein BBA_09121 [Beauveria bassiana ARSEF 2860]|uniref:Uncharacterized protein n=1 Tax=Beauveria bassiana (strain ARSEF 2860) TaxID=655819 RepID=J4VTU8_BEAB2|nr:uncharacterized protein BBA_09121 [Beauveria bassiana ARSEF 2860]EJP61965.1 hypothetical protein BBA_09121 [Beauveria bassiana ARSEF 2860]